MFDETTKATTTTTKMTLPNVKELARRFETGARIEPKPSTKRIGKFRVIETNLNQSKIVRTTKNTIPRRRSSLKRRTRSIGELPVATSSTSSEVRKSRSIGDVATTKNRDELVTPVSVVVKERSKVPLPAPRSRLQTTSMIVESRKDEVPTYGERCRVSLTISHGESPSSSTFSMLHSPPPPLPSLPPSRERIRRIPSHLKPTPAPRTSTTNTVLLHATLPRPKFKSPPPPVPPPSDLPRVPSIPVPALPSSLEYNEDDDCYDEIILDPKSPNQPNEKAYFPLETHQCPDSVIQSEQGPSSVHNSNSSEYSYSYESTDFTKPSRSRNDDEEEVFDEATEAEENIVPKVKERFLSSTLQRNTKSNKRVSSMELEKLFRFKSELQLNLSKKVGQFRQKVGERSSKRRSKCHVSVDLLDTDFSSAMSKSTVDERYQDDTHIYGDGWSSEDDDIYHDDRRSSMYRQLEDQINQAFPDYSARSQMSSDYESADLLLSGEGGESTKNHEDGDADHEEEMPKFVARPAIGHLPLDEAWTPPIVQDEPSPDEEEYKRQYTFRMVPKEQPLYQHYMMEARVESATADEGKSNYEDIKVPEDVVVPVVPTIPEPPAVALKPATRRESSISSDSGRGADCSTTSASALTSTTSMRRDRLVGASNFGSQRSLWCELPEVKAAGLLESLDDECKIQQEAYFEVITSEASYLRSLNVLITHFMASPQMLGSKSTLSVLSDSDRKHLFSNIFAVRDCSERLLCDLETRLEENLVLDDICDILREHFDKYFEVYVKYCSNQVYQDRTLRRLKTDNPGFLSAVQKLEENRQCQGLDMRSFLMLPMQRITRYPLLLYAIIERLNVLDDRYKTASEALICSNRVVRDCNEGARRMERTEQLLEIDKRLIYKDADLKRIPLVSNSRYLVKRGVLTQLVERRSSNILQSRQKARTLHVFLFSDMIMITKKKLNGTYVCKDYAARRFVDMQPIEPDNPKIPIGAIHSLVGRPHLFLCTLMRNARDKQTELLLSADSETDRERWLSAVRPPTSTNPEEKVYAEWDCPQAVAVHAYQPSQNDELLLNVGDTINILQKMPDGWLFGERVGYNVGGWFPSSYVQNIVNDHTRANNYRQRLRLIQAASGWHGNISSATTGRGGMPLMDRLRRMSSPKTYFQSGTVGL